MSVTDGIGQTPCSLKHYLVNDVRMTTFTHQLLSRKTSTPEVWQCEYYGVRRCSFSFNQAES